MDHRFFLRHAPFAARDLVRVGSAWREFVREGGAVTEWQGKGCKGSLPTERLRAARRNSLSRLVLCAPPAVNSLLVLTGEFPRLERAARRLRAWNRDLFNLSLSTDVHEGWLAGCAQKEQLSKPPPLETPVHKARRSLKWKRGVWWGHRGFIPCAGGVFFQVCCDYIFADLNPVVA